MLTALPWLVILLVALPVALIGGLVLFSAWTAGRVEKAVPPIGRFVDIEGTRIHYLDEGTGPAIVFLHGLAGQMQHLTYALRERLRKDYRVIFMDRPGAGYSERKPGASARLTAQADVVAAFIEKLGLERPLLVGHSLGGAVVLATALDHPAQVGGVALIAPLTHLQSDVPPSLSRLAIASPVMRRIVAWTLAIPATIRNGPAALREIFAPDAVPADFGTRGGGLLGLRPKAFYSASSDMVAVQDDLEGMAARYPDLAIPVGILYGTADRVLDHKVQGEPMLAEVPGLTLDLIENGGHMLPITATERAAQLIISVAGRMGAAAWTAGASPSR